MRNPEATSLATQSALNITILSEFYSKLEAVYTRLKSLMFQLPNNYYCNYSYILSSVLLLDIIHSVRFDVLGINSHPKTYTTWMKVDLLRLKTLEKLSVQ